MTASHHPLPETLISYVSGALPNATSCVVACHLSMCGDCAGHIRRLEIVGGVMLTNLQTARADDATTEKAIALWSSRTLADEPLPGSAASIADPLLPSPLARYMGMSGAQVSWEKVTTGERHYRVALPKGSGQIRLLRLTPGQRLAPRAGVEEVDLALVLQGAFSDSSGDYVRGDIIELSGDMPRDVRAVADIDCICMVASGPRPTNMHRRDRARTGSFEAKPFLPDRHFRDIQSPSRVLMASAVVLVGIGLGWWLRGGKADFPSADNLVRIEGNRLIATGPLQTALQSLPSGGKTTAASPETGKLRLNVAMTFQNQSGDYCRQYNIAAASSGDHAGGDHVGIACHVGDEWVVRMQALVPPASSAAQRTIPAGGGADPAMDAAIGALIDGDPVVGPEEAALMRKGWKK